jgi:hypothetical protein
MAISGHFEAEHEGPESYLTPEAGRRINMAKLMGLSILTYTAVPILIFFAADRAFEGNWSGVLGFLLDAAGCALLARMVTWASRNL